MEQISANSRFDWLTAKEAADYLRISVKTLYNLRNKGNLGGSKLGGNGKILYSREELVSYITRKNSKSPKKKSA